MPKSRYIVVLIIVIFINLTLRAQSQYTLFAESGLSLRSEASIDSERVQVVPFKGKVSVHKIHYDKLVTIEEVTGYWVEVSFEEERGFMFSGYLVPRNYYESKEGEYVILDEFEDEYDDIPNGTLGYLDLLKFDNSLNWYGVKISDENTTLKKVNFELQVYPQRIQNLYEDKNDNYIHPVQDSIASLELVEDQTVYNFYLGAKEDIADWTNASFLYNEGSSNQPGKFVSPYQPISLINGEYMQSEIIVDDGCTARYEICLLDEIYQKYIVLNWDGENKRSIEAHLSYQSPRLVWEGDINQDGYSDFLFYVSPMADKCVRSHHELYISRENNDRQLYYQVHYGVNMSSMNYY